MLKEVAHHKDRQHQAGDEEWNTEDQTDGCALTQRQTDDQPGNEENQANGNTEGETVGTIKRTA
jgi:hypothetical protein